MSEQNSELRNPTAPFLYHSSNYYFGVSYTLPENPRTFIATIFNSQLYSWVWEPTTKMAPLTSALPESNTNKTLEKIINFIASPLLWVKKIRFCILSCYFLCLPLAMLLGIIQSEWNAFI